MPEYQQPGVEIPQPPGEQPPEENNKKPHMVEIDMDTSDDKHPDEVGRGGYVIDYSTNKDKK